MQALWMSASSFLFATMGVCVKFASSYFTSAELVFYRGVLGMAFMAAYAWARGTPLASRYPAMHAWRSVIGVVSLSAWFYAIAHLPLATAMTLNYMSSVWIAAFLVGARPHGPDSGSKAIFWRRPPRRAAPSKASPLGGHPSIPQDERREGACSARTWGPRPQRRAAPSKASPLGGQRVTRSERTWGQQFCRAAPSKASPLGGQRLTRSEKRGSHTFAGATGTGHSGELRRRRHAAAPRHRSGPDLCRAHRTAFGAGRCLCLHAGHGNFAHRRTRNAHRVLLCRGHHGGGGRSACWSRVCRRGTGSTRYGCCRWGFLRRWGRCA